MSSVFGTTNLQVARKRERELIENAGRGLVATNEQGPKRLSEAIESYLTAKRMRCSPRTIELEEERLSLVKKHFGDVPLSAITALAIADFQRARHDAGIANRTINMDVGVLSRVLESCGRWRALAEHVRNLPERQRPIGRPDGRRAKTFVRRSRLESGMGARVLRRDRRGEHVNAPSRSARRRHVTVTSQFGVEWVSAFR